MKLLAIHRYFWPDVAPYASILRAIAGHFACNGHEVIVVTGRPGYRGQNISAKNLSDHIDGFRVSRIWLFPERHLAGLVKIFNALLMAVRVFAKVLREKPDIVIASTAPPFFLSGASALACRLTGSRFIYHCMDIHPEIGSLQGHFKMPGLRRVLAWFDGWICRSAWRVIVLSMAMKDVLLSARPGLSDQAVLVINNPALPVFDEDSKTQEVPEAFSRFQGRRVIFAGNVGRFQSLDSLVLAFRDEKIDSDVGLFIAGSGSEVERLKVLAGADNGKRIFFLGQQKPAVVNRIISKSCVGIVSVQHGVDQFAFPSKLINYIAYGCPIFVIAASGAYLQNYVAQNSLGWSAEQNNVQSITNAIQSLLTTDELEAKSAHVKNFYDEELSLSSYLIRWNVIIAKE